MISSVEAVGCKKRRSANNGSQKGWVLKHQQVKEEENIVGCASWTANKKLGGIADVGAERVRDLLDIAYAVMKKKEEQQQVVAGKDQLANGVFVDISQCASRHPWTECRVRALTTSSDIFSFKRRRTLIPKELFAIMGWKNPSVDGLSFQQQRNLIAENMALPCLGLVLLAMTTSLPGFWSNK